MSAQVLDGFLDDISDQIIAALRGPRGGEIAALVMSRVASETITTIVAIQSVAAKHYGCGLTTLRGPRRDRLAVEPRSVAIYLARSMTRASYPEIGRAFLRDHTTVRSAYRRIERRLIADDDLRDTIDHLSGLIRNTGPANGLAKHG